MILIELLSNLNEELRNAIKSSRIKFTSFDVSRNYIVFGANTGGIYVFSRSESWEACKAINIIPARAGCISLIAVSPDESAICFSTTSGQLILAEKPFHCTKPPAFKTFLHHQNNFITAITWKLRKSIAVIVPLPSMVLMELDSAIIQIDCWRNFMLISTLKTTYLCDTNCEMYRQIGTLPRNGSFGACFFDATSSIVPACIFCTRPGLRLWKSDFDATVNMTFKLKHSLAERTSMIIFASNQSDHLGSVPTPLKLHSQSNFSKLYALTRNYLLSFNDTAIYIFHVTSNNLSLYYTFEFENKIQDVKIIGNHFYVFSLISQKLRSFYMCDSEELVTEILNLEAVISKGVDSTRDIDNGIESALQKLHAALTEQDIEKIRKMPIKRNTLAVIDENKSEIENIHLSDSEETSCDQNNGEHIEFRKNEAHNSEIIVKQFKLNQVYDLHFPDFQMFVNNASLTEIVTQFQRARHSTELNDTSSFDKWFEEIFFTEILTGKIVCSTEDRNSICEVFRIINNKPAGNCGACLYPIPSAKLNKSVYCDQVCDILRTDVAMLRRLAESVPCVWRYLLKPGVMDIPMHELLPILMQCADITILEQYSSRLTYDLLDDCVQLLLKLRRTGQCLVCNAKVAVPEREEHAMEVSALGRLAINVIGPVNTLKLLQSFSGAIGNGELSAEFYRHCIFMSICPTEEETNEDEVDRRVRQFLNKEAIIDALI